MYTAEDSRKDEWLRARMLNAVLIQFPELAELIDWVAKASGIFSEFS